MSDLKPKGYVIVVDGVERKLLFTLNAIDAIQSEFDQNVIEVIDKVFNGNDQEQIKTLRKVIEILLNDEAEREEFFHPGCGSDKMVTEKEVGWIIDRYNLDEMKIAIAKAYGISMPDVDEDDPNQTGGQQTN